MCRESVRERPILECYDGGVVGAITVEIKPEMIGHYLAEFSITYKPIKHGRAGMAGSKGAMFVPLK